jgi:hypothetical protein
LTFSGRPRNSLPASPAIAANASDWTGISTKPKPRAK